MGYFVNTVIILTFQKKTIIKKSLNKMGGCASFMDVSSIFSCSI